MFQFLTWLHARKLNQALLLLNICAKRGIDNNPQSKHRITSGSHFKIKASATTKDCSAFKQITNVLLQDRHVLMPD